MRIIPRISHFESSKNGTITVFEFLWQKKLYAGGFEQSGPYVLGLWRGALRKIKKPRVASILIIGLGLGDNVRIAQKKFPHAQCTVIEWDPVIIKLAREVSRLPETIQIIEGDLRDALPVLSGPYDLILSDAFFGDKPDVGLGTEVGESFKKLLSPSGAFLLNASRTPAAIDYVSRFLKLQKSWKFKDNIVALFNNN